MSVNFYSLMIYNEKLPTAVMWWKKHFLFLNFAFNFPLPKRSLSRRWQICLQSLSALVCASASAPQRSNSKGLETSADLMKNWSACLFHSGWLVSVVTVCSLSLDESQSDRWQIKPRVCCGFPLNLSLISGQECYDPLTKLSILPFVWTCLSPCWL